MKIKIFPGKKIYYSTCSGQVPDLMPGESLCKKWSIQIIPGSLTLYLLIGNFHLKWLIGCFFCFIK